MLVSTHLCLSVELYALSKWKFFTKVDRATKHIWHNMYDLQSSLQVSLLVST